MDWIKQLEESVEPINSSRDERRGSARLRTFDEQDGPSLIDYVERIESADGSYPSEIEAIVGNSPRIDWELVGSFEGQRVVDINGGYCGLPHPITWQAKSVILVSPSRERLQFAARAAEILGLDNFEAVRSPDGKIPIATGSVDRILLNRTAEKPALYADSDSVTRSLVKLLAKCRRKLTSDGTVFVASENRLNVRGITEGDTLRTLLDRSLPRSCTRLGTPSEVTLSERTYRAILRKAGFGTVDAFYSLDPKSETTLFSDGERLGEYVLQKLETRFDDFPWITSASAHRRLLGGVGSVVQLTAPSFLLRGSVR